MRRCLITLLLGLALSVGDVAVSAEPIPARSSPTQIRRWIEELDHDDFFVREKAAASLAAAGPSAINLLATGVLSDSPEVAWRCSEVLERMAMEGDELTVDRIVAVLNDLSKRGKPGLAQIAAEMRDRQKTFRHNRAVAELRKLGGRVGGSYDEALGEDVVAGMVFGGFGGAIVEIDVAPAAIEIEEPRPADEGPIEPLEMVELPPVLEKFGIGRLFRAPDADLEAEEPAAEKPAVAERVGGALLPGRIGGAIRRAFGKGLVEVHNEPVHPDFALEPPDFRLPSLEDEDEWLADLATEDIFPGDDMITEVDELVLEEMEFAAAPPIALAAFMPADEAVPSGLMFLTREWRGGDEGLKYAKDLFKVSTLQIEYADLSDAALPHIAKMPALRHFQIRGGKFSREALRAFHRQRTNVSIMALGEGMMGVNGSFTAGSCLLDTVFPGSGAHDGGLQAGDEILSIAGEKVRDFSDLTISVSTRKPGEKMKVVYKRDGREHETEITLKPRAPGQ